MKVCIIGAGAIGGLLGVKLSVNTDAEVTMVARGTHLEAIRRNGGLTLVEANGMTSSQATRAKYVASVEEVERGQDVVILAIKEHQILPIKDEIIALLNSRGNASEENPETSTPPILLTTQNGVPWWFFLRHSACPKPEWRDSQWIEAVDPDGELLRSIEAKYIVGCVVYPAASITAPGVVTHHEGNRFPIGEIDGARSQRVVRLSELLICAGFKSFVLDNIRNEIWLKVWGSAAFNPLSALTHATLARMCRYEPSNRLIREIMQEVAQVGRCVGAGEMRVSIDKRIDGAFAVGEHKTSMVQDVENGRPTEVEAIAGAILELAELTSVPTPSIRAIYASIKLLEQVMQSEQVAIQPVPT